MARELLWFEGFSGTKGWDGHQPWNFSEPSGPAVSEEPTTNDWLGIVENAGRYYGPAHQGLRPQSYGQAALLTTPNLFSGTRYLWAQWGYWMRIPIWLEGYSDVPYFYSNARPTAHSFTPATYTANESYTNWGAIALQSGTWKLRHNYSGVSPTGDVWGSEVPANCPYTHDGNWHWVEERLFASTTTTGVYELRIDEIVIGRMTGIRTANYINSGGWNTGEFKANDSYSNWLQQHSDDVYFMLADSEGELNWIGKSGVEGLIASGDGDLSEGTPSVGSSHSAVIKLPRDDDTYITLTTGSKSELFIPSEIDQRSPRTVYGVKVAFVARKTGPAVRQVRPIVKVNGVQYNGTAFNIHSGWREHAYIWETNPYTGSAWTASQVEDAQFGFEQIGTGITGPFSTGFSNGFEGA